MVRRVCLAIALAALAVACAPADPLKGLQPGETGRVVRVIDGDALVLDTGLSVRLAGVEAPAGATRSRAAAEHAEPSARVLETLTMGRRVALFHGGLSRDRYGRAIAQVRLIDELGPKLWVNLAVVEAGAARVRLYPDNETLAAPLLAAEEEARAARRGVWALADYAVRRAEDVDPQERGFLIVEGVLQGRAPPSSRPAERRREEPEPEAACRLRLGALAVVVAPGAESVCATPDAVPVRVRGYLREGELSLTTPGNLEVLSPAAG